MKKTFFVYGLILLAFAACTSSDCKLKEIVTMRVEKHWHPGTTPAFTHYVMVKGFAKDCMDSVIMVNMALKYADTVSIGTTADIIRFYPSDDIFNTDKLIPRADLNRYCLVEIKFHDRKPVLFTSYKDNGGLKYMGSSWITKPLHQ